MDILYNCNCINLNLNVNQSDIEDDDLYHRNI